jgi:WD40 repeat protein
MSLPDLIELSPNIQHNSAENPNEDDPCISSIAVSSSVVAATQLCGNVALFETNDYLNSTNNNNQKPRPFTTFTAHHDALNYCKFLSKVGNGTFLATCSDDSSVRIFDCKNINNNNRGYPIALYPAPAEVNCLCESTDGTKLYAGCDDGSVVVYTYGQFADATKLQVQNNDNNNDQSPFPDAAPPAQVDRFMVGEGSVNDLVVVQTSYGDLLFTATDDGSVRGWKTFPGQRAPNTTKNNNNNNNDNNNNENQNSGPTREEIAQQMNEAMSENNQQVDNNEMSEEERRSADVLRQMIADSLGDESADRLLTSCDTFKGGLINHIASTTISGDAALLIATGNYVFAVLFDVGAGELAEDPAIMFQGNEDFVRGILPTPNGSFLTVADDGAVCLFTRELRNQQEPVEPLKKFFAENQGLNIMSSAILNNGAILLTGSLYGSLKMWKL